MKFVLFVLIQTAGGEYTVAPPMFFSDSTSCRAVAETMMATDAAIIAECELIP